MSKADFERGWVDSVKAWKSGTTWEDIVRSVDYAQTAYCRGMVAAVEAMSGWEGLAERSAKLHQVADSVLSNLLHMARTA